MIKFKLQFKEDYIIDDCNNAQLCLSNRSDNIFCDHIRDVFMGNVNVIKLINAHITFPSCLLVYFHHNLG